jgi:hypothetical protein
MVAYVPVSMLGYYYARDARIAAFSHGSAEQFAPDTDIVHVCGLEKVCLNLKFLFGRAAAFRSTVVQPIQPPE